MIITAFQLNILDLPLVTVNAPIALCHVQYCAHCCYYLLAPLVFVVIIVVVVAVDTLSAAQILMYYGILNLYV